MDDDGPTGHLAIAFVPGVTLTRWTRAWAERRPDVLLTVTETSEAEQVAVLRDGRAQLGFVRLPVDADGLHVIPLYGEVAVAVAAKEHAIAAVDSLTLADLEGEAVRTGSSFGRDDFDLVAAGVGILLVPHSIARLQSRRDLVSRPVTDAAETRIALAWRAEPGSDLLASRIEEFVGIVRGRTARSSRSAAAEDPSSARASAKPGAAKATQSKAKRPTPSRGAAFAQQRKNAAARKRHRPH